MFNVKYMLPCLKIAFSFIVNTFSYSLLFYLYKLYYNLAIATNKKYLFRKCVELLFFVHYNVNQVNTSYFCPVALFITYRHIQI